MRQNDSRFTAPETPQVNQVALAGLNYVAPTELVELPSKGCFYPPDHPLYDKECVEIKQMTAKEEDILTSVSLIEKGVVLDYLIQNLLIDKNINAKTLLSGDRSAILLNARINAYGADYEFEIPCTKCDSIVTVNHDLTTVKNKNIDFDNIFDEGCIKLVLPKTEALVRLKLLNEHEQNLLSKEVEKHNNMGLGDSPVTTFLRYIIYSINGHINNNSSEFQKFIENMPSMDVKFLRKKYAEFKPDVDFSCDIECNNCNHTERRQMPITAQFFWP